MTKAIKKAVQERAKHCCEYCLSQSKISADTFTELLGISPIGRARVQKLQLNRRGLINLRQVFVQVGLHPPY
jgi:hypothetical protein